MKAMKKLTAAPADRVMRTLEQIGVLNETSADRVLKILAAEDQLAALRAEIRRPETLPETPAAADSSAKPSSTRKPTATAALTKARKLQGRYLGLRRTVPAKVQAAAQKLARDKGVAAAVAFLVKARKAAAKK